MAVFRYFVADVARAVDFYTRHLGFTLTQDLGDATAAVTRDDVTLWLSGPGSSAARSMPDGRRPGPGGWNRLILTITDLPSRMFELQAAGLHFRHDIVGGPDGRKTLLEDPDGNQIELFEPAAAAAEPSPATEPKRQVR